MLNKNYLKYLVRFYEECGCDVDYIDQLSAPETHFLCEFILEHYGGVTHDILLKKRANHHRYATGCDALVCLAIPSSERMLLNMPGGADPEVIYLTDELIIKKIK